MAETTRIIVRVAAAGDGVMTRRSLLAAGISPSAIDRRIAAGLLVPCFRGVYRIGPHLAHQRQRFVAALLAGGDSAALCGVSAAVHWGILPPRGDAVHLSVPTARRVQPGLRCHRRSLPERSLTVRDGLRCTTVARTLRDLAAELGEPATTRAWSSAASRRLIRPADVAFEVELATGRPGIAPLRRLLEIHDDYTEQRTRSELERLALRVLRAEKIRKPACNQLIVIGDRVVEGDLVWAPERIVVELDGRSAHEHALQFEDDRERDVLLGLAGWRSVRWTWGDLTRRVEQTMARHRATLVQAPLQPAREFTAAGGAPRV